MNQGQTMRLALIVVLGFLSGCGAGFRSTGAVVSTKRVYATEHGLSSRLEAFDELEEWIAINWNSPRFVTHLSKERTGAIVLKWNTTWRDEYRQRHTVDITSLFKVDEAKATFTFISNELPVDGWQDIYARWDRMMADGPFGSAAVVEKGTVPTKDEALCRSDRDCDRGQTCSEGACREE